MGLFSSEAHVSLDTVRRFKEEVNAFSSEINNVSSTISKQINEGLEEAVQKAKTFEKLKNECSELYEEIKKRKSELEQLVHSLEEQLSSTPKEIEIEKKNSDGSVSTETKPNPEYARIQKELKEAKAKLSKIKDLSWKVYNKKSELDRLTSQAYEYTSKIESQSKNVNSSFNELQSKANIAESSISRTCDAVEKYISVNLYK